ncbi:MAG: ComF family protein [Alphaproteobacteria bacterium]|nr:ComF family protein [Alphaproteobacteria bacterium]MCB9928447.1 ComF family protein [Alphaproteobacteria bacterium]
MALPPRCLACQEPLAPPGGLCPDCWPMVRFLSEPLCERCGIPLEAPGQDICGHCVAEPPAYDRARAVFAYEDGSRELVLRLKHADALAGVPVLARWMARPGADMLRQADWLVPVPLHWRRLFQRRYNQSAELARALARIAGVPALPDGLVRVRKTPSQGGLSRRRRRANVLGAFAVADRHRHRIDGRRVIVVDDVMTTGATAEACATALLAAGASGVDVLCLARVEAGTPLP